MKQCITVEQLEELKSDDKVCKLNTLMGHNWMIPREEMSDMTWNKILKDTAEYCTIGKMIEIAEPTRITYNAEYNGWDVIVGNIAFAGVELCDALWEAVKATLITKFEKED